MNAGVVSSSAAGRATQHCSPCSVSPCVATIGRGALRMGDAAPGRHPVDLARPDGDGAAEAVAVHDLAGKQERHGGEPDMRMRAHVEPLAAAELDRAHLVEKDEGSDHAALRRGQGAAHLKAAEVARARHDHLRDRFAGEPVAGGGVRCGKETHARLQSRRPPQPMSSGSVPFGLPLASSVIFSTRASACRSKSSQRRLSASPRS